MVLSQLKARFGGGGGGSAESQPRQAYPAEATAGEQSDSEASVLHDGDLAYVRVKGGNGSLPSYQEAVGAPVEGQSPLGYDVGWATVIFLNVNQMIGSGIFSTREFRFLSPSPPVGTCVLTDDSICFCDWIQRARF